MSNFEFKYILNAFFLVIPIGVLCILILGNKKKAKILKRVNLKDQNRFKKLKNLLIFLGMTSMVVSLMGPQMFRGTSEVKGKGLDIYILMDTSKSMLVEDIKPSRISRAVKVTEEILMNLKGDRVGFIPFSSSAYVQMPLTDDYNMAKMFLNVVDTDMISGGGSDIGKAIKMAHKSFEETSSGNKVIIVLSDGEEFEKKSAEVVKELNDEELKVYTVGIGTEKGGLIPEYDYQTGANIGFKKDASGETIISRVDALNLRAIAKAGNGRYYNSTVKGEEIGALVREIDKLEKSSFKSRKVKDYDQIYQYFLGAGLILFSVAFMLPERRKAQ